MIKLELPYPPSINHYYRRVGSRTLISREGRRFREKVCAILAVAGVGPLTGLLRIEIEIYPPDRRKRDTDNILKALFDALEHGGLFRDDNQIKKMVVERCEWIPGGRTLVRIEKV